jgi:predicted regulator of amino acid metabolism with ACT domain
VQAKLTIVVEGQLTGNAIEEIQSLKVVRSLKILK